MIPKNVPLSESVFVLRIKNWDDKITYPQELGKDTLGYFTSYQKAEYYISLPQKDLYWFLKDVPFKIFEIEEFGLNYPLMDINTRIYDATGNFIGEHPSDNDKGFPGREEKDCRFKLGDIVEFVQGNILDIGIVVGLPPDKARVKKVVKAATKELGFPYHPFDASDDCYLLLTGFDDESHAHPQVNYVFPPSGKIPARLRKRLIERWEE